MDCKSVVLFCILIVNLIFITMKFSRTNVFVAAFAVFALILIEVDCKSGRSNYQEKEITNDDAVSF